MRVAAVQLECTDDRDRNFSRAASLIDAAAAGGAELIVLPELFASLGSGRAMRDVAEPADGPTFEWAALNAEASGAWLLAGSIVEYTDDGRYYNTALLVSPTGELTARYRKIHLFDVEVDDTGARESDLFSAGDEVVVVPIGDTTLGLTTCYDLRFPELYRIVTLTGARVVVVPSAFTARTGRDHWHLLVRARAVENQVFVVAPDQCGTSPDGVARYGHSLIVDPWGAVLADGGDDEGVSVVDLDLAELDRVRTVLPSLDNRRPVTYRWPD